MNKPQSIPPHCPNHRDQEILVYCKTCSRTLCAKCVGESSHFKHMLYNIKKAPHIIREQLNETLQRLSSQKLLIENDKKKLELQVNSIQKGLEDEIHRILRSLNEFRQCSFRKYSKFEGTITILSNKFFKVSKLSKL